MCYVASEYCSSITARDNKRILKVLAFGANFGQERRFLNHRYAEGDESKQIFTKLHEKINT